MKYGSVCSGVEAATLAWDMLGWKPVFFSEVEPFPCAVLQERLGATAPINPLAPEEATSEEDRKMRESWKKQNELLKKEGVIPNEGDFTKIGKKYEGQIDLLVGGTPCFVAGTMVLTPKGYVPIETLQVEDTVISGEGIERKVEAVGSKLADIGCVKIVGRPQFFCTDNHPFYCVDVKRDNQRKSSTYSQMIPVGDYHKVPVGNAVGKYVGRVKVTPVKAPAFPVVYDANEEQIMELAGWYLGDGYIRRWHGTNKKAVVFCLCNKNKIDTFNEHFGKSINYSIGADGKITVACTALANWLSENFGELAENKKIPYWCYGSDSKYALLRGYRCTDGCEQDKEYKFTTVSKALAYGMADLMGDASVSFRATPDTAVIDGRTINQKDCYCVHFYKNKTIRTKNFNGRYASKIRSFINAGIDIVYNITVAEDHTYIANGIYVGNCQDLSVAGKRAGFEGERSSLAIDFVRLAYESKCKWVVWENVPGVFSSNGGRDFARFLSLLSGAEVTVPVNGWGTAGFVCNARADRYGVSWRTLDGQFTRTSGFPFAVPQRRRRVFVVGYLGDWTRAAEVLLEPSRLSWNNPSRFKARERVADFAEKCTGTAGTNNAVNFASSSFGNYSETDFGGTLKSSGGDLAGGSENLIAGIGIDCYNQNVTGDVSMTVTSVRSDFHHVPCFLENKKDSGFWNGNDFAETLKTNCNSDRMPDKGKLNCVIEQIVCASFLGTQGSKARGIGYSEEHAPTLRAGAEIDLLKGVLCCNSKKMGLDIGDNLCNTLNATDYKEPQVVCYENHANDSRVKEMGDCCQALTSRAGTGGGNLPLVQEYYNWHSQSLACTKIEDDCSPTIPAAMGMGGTNMTTPMFIQDCYSLDRRNQSADAEVSNTVNTCCGGDNYNTVAVQECYAIDSMASNAMKSSNPNSGFHKEEIAKTLDTFDPNPAKNQGGNVIVGFDGYNGAVTADTSATLGVNCGMSTGRNGVVDAVAIAENVIGRKVENGGNGVGAQEELAYTQNATGVMGVSQNMTVRRLLPIECERLMAFPDDWTKIPYKGKSAEECPDSPRYKACGNSMCVNVMRWIGERIDKIEKERTEKC